MFFEGIRSERQLMWHAADRLSLLWYMGYDLNESLPDHSSLSKIRQRYGLPVFETSLRLLSSNASRPSWSGARNCTWMSTQVNANADLNSLTPAFCG